MHRMNARLERVVHDYFACKAPIFEWTKQADEVIRWLRSRTYLLALLRDIQMSTPGFQGQPKTVIRGVATRWTSHYLAYRRLLELQPALQLLARDSRLYLSGNAESHAKTQHMLPIIQDGLFWHSVLQVKKHLEPLAIATNVTQSDNCRLDEVLITFGVLLHAFDSLDDTQQIITDAVTASLEKRWDKSDQDVFIAAVILNPFIRTQPFRQLPELFTPAAIYLLLERLWTRFYPETSVPDDFYTSVKSYLSEDGQFATLSKTMTAVTNAAKAHIRKA
ncbi:ribonuclease H-like domain-containing protein [Cubamyces lactineus]|nr:ribonuclease H-like domain-containing protein [Cubamyces lactineus]